MRDASYPLDHTGPSQCMGISIFPQKGCAQIIPNHSILYRTETHGFRVAPIIWAPGSSVAGTASGSMVKTGSIIVQA